MSVEPNFSYRDFSLLNNSTRGFFIVLAKITMIKSSKVISSLSVLSHSVKKIPHFLDYRALTNEVLSPQATCILIAYSFVNGLLIYIRETQLKMLILQVSKLHFCFRTPIIQNIRIATTHCTTVSSKNNLLWIKICSLDSLLKRF